MVQFDRLHVLIVEDNPGDARLLQLALTESAAGTMDLEHVTTLAAALERLGRGGVDVVLLDLGLPDSQRMHTFAEVRAHAQEAAVIVLTGLDDEDLALEAVRQGAQDYLVKGEVTGPLLVRATRYAWERRRIKRQLGRYNQELEAKVQERTAELERANELLREENDQRRRIEAELARVNKLESLGVLAGGIAHEFNNLLMVILGNLSVVTMSETLTPDGASRVEAAELAVDRARGLTTQLLTFAEGGAPMKAPTDVVKLLQEVPGVALCTTATKCRLAVEEALWQVDGDATQLRQVLQNLLMNAADAMPGGGTIEVRARNVRHTGTPPLPLPPGRYVAIEVEDHGVGIAPEHLERIFDPFFTTRAGATGLGLSTVHSIVRRHGGHVAVKSVPKAGTTVTCLLPAVAEATTEAAPPQLASGIPHLGGRILLMDDDAMVRMVTAEGLTRFGCTVVATSDGQEAVQRFRDAVAQQRPFDGVLLDLTVPGGMGGQETLEVLKGLDPAVRAVVFSGYSNAPVLSNFKDHGFVGALAKPFRLTELEPVVRLLVSKPALAA